MPLYSYKCTECGNAFDITQSLSDATLNECPACGGKLRKLFGTVGVSFNGSGFYSTDSKSGASGSSGGAKS
ncbi:FmdB family transcriptional regulator [Mycetocola tolaasinivorans]|uniref:FmdB family transcriptional regulator n=1 Tax=Mycetocola tolaasinivorans TaxID=76635 RepID=A0A3L7AB88_9MICO|nr:FmdB family zinc ribbon protein [Mycetocola tolaasinivorans]RLP77487.1 FmdB family transcriptional regulator [Mycetocola tolaasinivorans]